MPSQCRLRGPSGPTPQSGRRLPQEPEADTSLGGEQVVKEKHNMLGHTKILPQSIDVEKPLLVRILGCTAAFLASVSVLLRDWLVTVRIRKDLTMYKLYFMYNYNCL